MLDMVVADIHRGESRSLVLQGAAGVGKTALLKYLIASAPELSVVRAVGVESEMELRIPVCTSRGDDSRSTSETARSAPAHTGGRVRLDRRRSPDPFLVALGLSNSEIGTRLFLSPRTVEWHLSKVFGKLGVGSRKELRSALSEVGAVIAAV
jgi:DNA-binding transcriptional ArsR family regulator